MLPRARLCSLVSLVTLPLLLAAPAAAAPDPKPARAPTPRHRLVYQNLTAGRINPLGLANDYSIGYRLKLFDRPGALFQDTHLSLLASTFVTPADGEIGPMLVLQPLAVLRLWAKVAYYGTFGTFGILQSFQSPTADSSDTMLDQRKDQGLDYSPSGVTVTLGARLQAKVWRVALRNTLFAHYADLTLEPQDRVFYHSQLDVLFPDGGWVLRNELDLICFTGWGGLLLGARYTVIHALYPESVFFPGEPTDNPNSPIHRVGPMAVYTFFDRPGARFNTPSLILILQWHAKHRYRTGADVSAALPQIIVGFAFSGDLAP